MPRVVVRDVTSTQVFRTDGEQLRYAIEQVWSDAEPLEVDFNGLRIDSASFFDESFGYLALSHPLTVVRRRLRPVGLSEPDRALLNSIVVRRARERLERLVFVETVRLSKQNEASPVSMSDLSSESFSEQEAREVLSSLEARGLVRTLPDGRIRLSARGRAEALSDRESATTVAEFQQGEQVPSFGYLAEQRVLRLLLSAVREESVSSQRHFPDFVVRTSRDERVGVEVKAIGETLFVVPLQQEVARAQDVIRSGQFTEIALVFAARDSRSAARLRDLITGRPELPSGVSAVVIQPTSTGVDVLLSQCKAPILRRAFVVGAGPTA
jgi:Mn-dependent DtxR family transcriptional regulator